MGLFTLLNCAVLYVQLDYLKSYILDSKSRPLIPEFCGSHCSRLIITY